MCTVRETSGMSHMKLEDPVLPETERTELEIVLLLANNSVILHQMSSL